MTSQLLIVGAGVAGLACAATAAGGGLRPLVMDKSRGVGGRCATRRLEGQPVDHGLAFFHGSDPAFLEALGAVGPDEVLDGWPSQVIGDGAPCVSSAFRPGERRLAYASGATTFPKSLARGFEIRLGACVRSLAPRRGGWSATLDDGSSIDAGDVALALPSGQANDLVQPLTRYGRDLATASYLLGTMASVRCLTVLALYDPEHAPDWDLWYPGDSRVLQLISHDSSKRRAPRRTALVLQALPSWSASHWGDDESSWRDAILAEAARVVGEWAGAPVRVDVQRWRHGRTGSSAEVNRPLLCAGPRGGRLGLAGESFAAGGGVQAAWKSGRALALRLLDERSRG